jgi:hypothetical protein
MTDITPANPAHQILQSSCDSQPSIKTETDIIVDSMVLSYVKEQLALLEDIPRYENGPVTLNGKAKKYNISPEKLEKIKLQEVANNFEAEAVFIHDRVKVYWPNRNQYFFGTVLETDDVTKGSHIIRYEDDHEEVYSWLTGPQPANWTGPREKFSVLSQRKRRLVDYCESNKKVKQEKPNKKKKVETDQVEQIEIEQKEWKKKKK